MRGRIVAGLFLCSLFFVVGGDAQTGDVRKEKAVWTMQFIKAEPENFGLAMQYLDDHWMRVKAKAKQQGAVLDYHIISNSGVVTPGHKVSDQGSIVLLTKYKNMDAYLESLSAHEDNDSRHFVIGGVYHLFKLEDLFERNTQVFEEEPDTKSGFKLLTKQ